MYDAIVKELTEKNKQYKLLKKPLNRENLIKVIEMGPRVLFLNCHGERSNDPKRKDSYFCFESVSKPGMLEEFSEQNLFDILKNIDCKIKLVVISACHSSNLGKKLAEAGIPVVVCINISVGVLEQAAYAFNRLFLFSLLMGKKPYEAFERGVANVSSANEINCTVCCCSHTHARDCLWSKYKERHGQDKAHLLHEVTCTCFKTAGNK